MSSIWAHSMPCCAVWMPKRIGCRVIGPLPDGDPITGGSRAATCASPAGAARACSGGLASLRGHGGPDRRVSARGGLDVTRRLVPQGQDVRADELYGDDDRQCDDADGDRVLGEALP